MRRYTTELSVLRRVTATERERERELCSVAVGVTSFSPRYLDLLVGSILG